MTLLVYATDARQSTQNGSAFLRFLAQVSETLPGAHLLPISSLPPESTRPQRQLDWVTLPEGARRSIKFRLLQRYAEWFQPAFSLFYGDDASATAAACFATFGERWLHTDAGQWLSNHATQLTTDKLLELLRSEVPLNILVGTQGADTDVNLVLKARPEAHCVKVLCASVLGERGRAVLDQVLEAHDGEVELHLRLEQGLARERDLEDLYALSRQLGRLKLRVVAEKTVTNLIAQGLNQGWNLLGGAR